MPRYQASLESTTLPTSGNRTTRAHREEINTLEHIDEDALYDTRTRTNVVRQGTYKPARTNGQAKRRVSIHVHEQPRQQQQHQHMPIDPPRRFSFPRLPVYVGIVGLTMLGSWLGISMGIQMFQDWQDDLHYGRPRTYQTDAVVGHNHDSSTAPSHFLVLNLHGQIVVIEIAAGDPSKTHLYKTGLNLLGSGQDLTPAEVSFKDLDGDGNPDMIVSVGGQSTAFKNENDTFSTTPMKEVSK